ELWQVLPLPHRERAGHRAVRSHDARRRDRRAARPARRPLRDDGGRLALRDGEHDPRARPLARAAFPGRPRPLSRRGAPLGGEAMNDLNAVPLVDVVIDGTRLEVAPGTTVLEALRAV